MYRAPQGEFFGIVRILRKVFYPMMHFGSYIRRLRLRKGLAPGDLAAYIDVSPSHLELIENGKVNATKEHVFKLATFFDAHSAEMLIAHQKDRMHLESRGTNLSPVVKKTRSTVARLKRWQNMEYTLERLCRNQIQVRFHKPAYPLNLYIESLVYGNGHNLGYTLEKSIPDGASELIIELDDHERLLTFVNSQKAPVFLKNAWICGIQEQPLAYQMKGFAHMVYIRFHPGGFHELTGIRQSDLKNSVLPADLLLGSSVLQLRDLLLASKDPADIFRKVEQYFLSRFKLPGVAHAVVDYMCKYIDRPLPSLICKTGYSQKRVIQLFNKHVGIPPKTFQRIRRFNNALNQIHTARGPMNWPAVVFDNNYYDQAHFIKEFSHFAGESPEAYLETGSGCAKITHANR